MKIKKSYIFVFAAITVAAIVTVLIGAVPALAKTDTNAEAKRAVPFSEVEVNDGFLRDYMKLVICEVIPTAIQRVEEKNGGIDNIKNCAIWHRGGEHKDPEGAIYVDSDVHKVLESMCMALDTQSYGDVEIETAQAAIKAKLEEWIPYYVDAPEKDGSEYPGYFDSYWSLKDTGYAKYSNVDNHELYCQGHFMEAAVAHYRYTKHLDPNNPDTRLLDVAIKSADHIVNTFGTDTESGKLNQMPGHQEIELALMKLAKLCQEIGGEYAAKADGYIDKAEYFLEVRGHDYSSRSHDIADNKRIYYQDLAPVSEQTTAVGHAVRAQYMYTGMCELATIKPEYATKYDNALTSLWDDVTNKKQYITGGIGDSVNNNEGFEDPYNLPNYASYCETCAGVANMLWNRSMSTLYDGSQYADQIETDLYNNVLGCVNFDGNKFYYQNRLATTKGFDRSNWYGTACCPPNFTRTILQVGGYVYNTTSNDIYINQFISNNANFSVGDNKVNVSMTSNFPYEGNGTIVVKPAIDDNFNIQIRKPSWTNNYTIKVNGVVVTHQLKDGYLVISGQTWSSAGTTIEFNFDMTLNYDVSNPLVTANNGLTALRRGPLYYCAESCDNSFEMNLAAIDPSGEYKFTKVDSLDGKENPYGVRTVYTLEHDGKLFNGGDPSDVTWKFIPYYARCNRDLGAMRVFVHDGITPVKLHTAGIPSASWTNTDKNAPDILSGLNDGCEEKASRWTSYNGSDVKINPYVQYDYNQPVKIDGFRVYWYDDKGGVQTPEGITAVITNDETGQTETIEFNDMVVNSSDDELYKTYSFGKTVEGNKIQMIIKNENKKIAPGIVEWELIDAVGSIYSEVVVAQQPTKTEYVVGESFDPSGMIIAAGYKDQVEQETYKQVYNYTCTPIVFDHAGQQEVVISYTEAASSGATVVSADGAVNGAVDGDSDGTIEGAGAGIADGAVNGAADGDADGTIEVAAAGIADGTINGTDDAITKTTTVTVNVKEASSPSPVVPGQDTDGVSAASGDYNWTFVLPSILLVILAGASLAIRRYKLK